MTRLPFITFEGSEGSGKSTQANRLAARLQRCGVPFVLTREPGGTSIGESIRDLLQFAPHNSNMTPETELLLFEASRSQLVREVIKPALERGMCVIADRFSDSTTVYQGVARKLDREMIERVNAFVVGDCVLTSLSCSMSMLRLLSRECNVGHAKRIGWNNSLLNFMSVFAKDIATSRRANRSGWSWSMARAISTRLKKRFGKRFVLVFLCWQRYRIVEMAFARGTALEFLRRAHEQNRLAHAYLITGPPGSGKELLAAELTSLVNRTPTKECFFSQSSRGIHCPARIEIAAHHHCADPGVGACASDESGKCRGEK